MVSVDESVTVSVNWAGEPVKFVWAGATYAITAKPVRWYDRRQWWAEAGRVQRGIGAQVLEVEMWQVQAELQDTIRATLPKFEFELMHSKNAWQLVRVAELADNARAS
jgi:hypothetical protein